MSQIYIKEPPTSGKVLLKTTLGDIDVELWSKETPLACRNFVQLCLEGYYNGSMFHRIIPEFMAQGGDPTGTGEGGESIYGHTFKDEFHSRLKFNRRGLVGMANGGRDDNASQFFITLNRADELSNKHTLFGKVTGDTLYNMIRLNEVQTDKEGRPLDPVPKILKTKVLNNPFDDIVPRIDPRKLEKKVEKVKSQSRATKDFGLLSFGDEAEDDEEETVIASKALKIKSSHDVLTEDPKLSAEPALDAPPRPVKDKPRERRKRKREADNAGPVQPQEGEEEEGGGTDSDDEAHYDRLMKEQVKKQLGHVEMSLEEELDWEEDKVAKRTEQLRMESKQLRRELKEAERRKLEEERKKQEEEREKEDVPEIVKAMRLEKLEYKKKKKTLKGGNREQQTLELLGKFKSSMFGARSLTQGSEVSPEGEAEGEEQEEEKPKSWLSHQIAFKDEEHLVLAKDASVTTADTYDIHDPRNPLNIRRRAEDTKKPTRGKGRDRDRTRN